MSEVALKEVNVEDAIKLQKIAQGLHQSGLFPQTKGPAGAYAIIQYGYELGLGPMTSLQNINLIQGKPAANGQTMLSLAMSRGVTFQVQEENSERCTIKFKRNDMEYISTFTLEDAKRAGLTGKDNWKNWPTEMLYWRSVAKGVRRIAPEAIMGLYTPEELTHGEKTEFTVQQPASVSEPEPPQEPVQEAEYAEPLITAAQLKKMATALGKLGFENKESKREAVNHWLHENDYESIESSKELTRQQAIQFISVLEQDISDPKL